MAVLASVCLVPLVAFADPNDLPAEVKADLLNRCAPAAKKACRVTIARVAAVDGDRIFALSLEPAPAAGASHHFFWSRQAGLHPASDFPGHLVKRKYRVSTANDATALAALAVLFGSPRVDRVFASGDDLGRVPAQKIGPGSKIATTQVAGGFEAGVAVLDHGGGWRFVVVKVSSTGACAVAGSAPK